VSDPWLPPGTLTRNPPPAAAVAPSAPLLMVQVRKGEVESQPH